MSFKRTISTRAVGRNYGINEDDNAIILVLVAGSWGQRIHIAPLHTCLASVSVSRAGPDQSGLKYGGRPLGILIHTAARRG